MCVCVLCDASVISIFLYTLLFWSESNDNECKPKLTCKYLNVVFICLHETEQKKYCIRILFVYFQFFMPHFFSDKFRVSLKNCFVVFAVYCIQILWREKLGKNMRIFKDLLLLTEWKNSMDVVCSFFFCSANGLAKYNAAWRVVDSVRQIHSRRKNRNERIWISFFPRHDLNNTFAVFCSSEWIQMKKKTPNTFRIDTSSYSKLAN